MARNRTTPARYNPPQRDKDAIEEVVRCVNEGKRWHNDFVKKVERRYSAWRGMLPENSKPKGWRSNQHPPYLINIVEGMLATIEDQQPIWEVKPRPLPYMDPMEALTSMDGADACGLLLSHQMRIDQFASKAGPFAHQDLIAGLTVGKVFWLRREVRRKFWDEVPELMYDASGGTLDIADKLEQFAENLVVRDDPTLEIRDVRDFMYPESATSLESAPWVIDRTFVTPQTLQKMEALGVYKNVKYINETRMDSTRPEAVLNPTREQRLHKADRTRGLVEIIELWTDEKVVTIANRSVLLRNEPNPFWHGRKPFVVCSSIPDLFQIPGVSVIEALASMQDMLWTLTNMRLDATRIAANVITMVRGDVDDPERYEWAPEAQWIVPDPNAVKVMDMSPVAAAAQATLQAEGILRGDMQNIMGGLPFTGGAQSQTLPTETATGVSIVTNIAQAILGRRKAQYTRSYGKAGQLFLELDQQFLTEDRTVEDIGEEGARRYLQVSPNDIEGVWDVDVEISGESMMRQERRAEWTSLLTLAGQSAPVMAQVGAPLNLRRFWEKLLDAYGVLDRASFFGEAPPPQQAQGAPGAPGSPPGPEGIADQMAQGALPPGGITNERLAAGNGMSASQPMQQALARTGAGRSV